MEHRSSIMDIRSEETCGGFRLFAPNIANRLHSNTTEDNYVTETDDNMCYVFAMDI
jgi:hypothetical protein